MTARPTQSKTSPLGGGSSGGREYFTSPESKAVEQVWQTPVRQDQRVGTSQSSAVSSKVRSLASAGTESALRAKVIVGPGAGCPRWLMGRPRGGADDTGVYGTKRSEKFSVQLALRETQALQRVLHIGHEDRRSAEVTRCRVARW